MRCFAAASVRCFADASVRPFADALMLPCADALKLGRVHAQAQRSGSKCSLLNNAPGVSRSRISQLSLPRTITSAARPRLL